MTAFVLMLSGCAAPLTHVALDSNTAAKISDVKVRSQIWQDEVIVRAQASNVAASLGGGLIAALIDSSISESRQGKAQSVIEPFYDSVDDVDFRQQFWTALDEALKDKKFALKVSAVEKSPALLTSAELKARREALSSSQGLMTVGVGYDFSHDFRYFNIVVGVDLFRGTQDTSAYTNIFTYQSAAVGAGGDASMTSWSESKGQRYRDAIKEGIAEVFKMLALDLPANGAPATGPAQNFSFFTSPAPMPINGPVLDQQKNRVVVRHSNGRVFSLPQ